MPLTRPHSASSGTLDGRCLCRHPWVGTPEQLISVGVPWAAGHADCCPLALTLGAPSWGPTAFPSTPPRRFSLRPQDVEAALMMVKTCAPLDTQHWGTHGGAALPSVAHRRSNYKRARTERAPSSSLPHPPAARLRADSMGPARSHRLGQGMCHVPTGHPAAPASRPGRRSVPRLVLMEKSLPSPCGVPLSSQVR